MFYIYLLDVSVIVYFNRGISKIARESLGILKAIFRRQQSRKVMANVENCIAHGVSLNENVHRNTVYGTSNYLYLLCRFYFVLKELSYIHVGKYI